MEALVLVVQREWIACNVLIKASLTCRTMYSLLAPRIAEKTMILKEMKRKESWWVSYQVGPTVEQFDIGGCVSIWKCASYLSTTRSPTSLEVARFQWIVCTIFEKINYVNLYPHPKFGIYGESKSRQRFPDAIFDEDASIVLANLEEYWPKDDVYVLYLLTDDGFHRFKRFVDPLPSLFLTSKPNFQRLL